MVEVLKLIEYAEMAGFTLSHNGDKLTVKNGTNLPYHLNKLLKIYKNEILYVLETRKSA